MKSGQHIRYFDDMSISVNRPVMSGDVLPAGPTVGEAIRSKDQQQHYTCRSQEEYYWTRSLSKNTTNQRCTDKAQLLVGR